MLMKRKRIIITIIIAVIFLGIINHETIQFFYYYLKSTPDTKQTIEKEYNISVNIIMQNKNIHLYEGLDKETNRKKYIIKVNSQGVFTLYADEGVDIASAQNIAKDKGFPSVPLNFYIKDSFSNESELKDVLYWYITDSQGKIIYISFKDGSVTYKN